MTQPIRLAINGASGRMGRALLALVREDSRFDLSAALVSANSVHNDTPVFTESPTSMCHSHDWAMVAADVVIDFSGPDGLAAALTYCTTRNVALVTGTTGVDA